MISNKLYLRLLIFILAELAVAKAGCFVPYLVRRPNDPPARYLMLSRLSVPTESAPLLVMVVLWVAEAWWNHRRYCLLKASRHKVAASVKTNPDNSDYRLHHKQTAENYRRAVWIPLLRLWITDYKRTP